MISQTDALVELAQKYRRRLAALDTVEAIADERSRMMWHAETGMIREVAVFLFGQMHWEHAWRMAEAEGPGHFDLADEARRTLVRGNIGVGQL